MGRPKQHRTWRRVLEGFGVDGLHELPLKKRVESHFACQWGERGTHAGHAGGKEVWPDACGRKRVGTVGTGSRFGGSGACPHQKLRGGGRRRPLERGSDWSGRKTLRVFHCSFFIFPPQCSCKTNQRVTKKIMDTNSTCIPPEPHSSDIPVWVHAVRR